MQPKYQITSESAKGSGKKRNGDGSVYFRFGTDNRYLAAMVADGVGSTSTDWLASRRACDQFESSGSAQPGDPQAWLRNTLTQIDEELKLQSQLLLCAAVAIVWEIGSSRLWYANVGDTRIYKVGLSDTEQLSEDESKAAVRRGSDGKPLISGGAAVVGRGITQALGNGRVSPQVKRSTIEAGEAILLCTDGFYGERERFARCTHNIFQQIDLESEVVSTMNTYRDNNDDDATVIVLRRGGEENVSEEEIENTLTGNRPISIAPHLMASAIDHRLDKQIEQEDEDLVQHTLAYLDETGNLLPEKRIAALKTQMLKIGWKTHRHHAILDTMQRRHIERQF